jgi:hypothetical protein
MYLSLRIAFLATPTQEKERGFRPSLTGSSGGYATVSEKLPEPEGVDGILAVTVIGPLTPPALIAGIVVGVVATVRPVTVEVPKVMAGVASFPVPVFSRQKNCELLLAVEAANVQGLILVKATV